MDEALKWTDLNRHEIAALRQSSPSLSHGSVTCPIVAVCRYRNGAQGKHGIQYLLYVVY